MQTLYLIRHGEPDFPGGEHMCIGRTDLALSPLGRMQAALLGFELAERVGRVYSSPLARARETAEGIAPAPELLPGLAEQDMGEWDGLRFSEIRRRWPELWARRESDKTIPMPGAEPDSAALSRFSAAVEGIFSRGGDAAAAAHSSVIRLYLNSLGAGMIKIPYGSYVVLHPGERPAPEEIGVLPHPELTDERCMALLRAAGNPGKVLRHCAAVAELATELAVRLGMDAVKIRRAALLHDVARLLPDHAAVGARWLETSAMPSSRRSSRAIWRIPGTGSTRRASSASRTSWSSAIAAARSRSASRRARRNARPPRPGGPMPRGAPRR